jgi:hypothetical protein
MRAGNQIEYDLRTSCNFIPDLECSMIDAAQVAFSLLNAVLCFCQHGQTTLPPITL